MCLEAVKIYGKSPATLLIIIKINRAAKGSVLPTNDVGPIKVLNSLWILFAIKLIVIKILVGVAQYKGVKIATKIKDLAQFKDTPIIDEGSNTENRLVIIIFNLI
jgi:hypothetical protein